MAAHRRELRASICVVGVLLAVPAPALAAPQLVPDEAALTEYVGVLPGAEGPLLPDTGAGSAGAAPSPSDALPARVDGALSGLPQERGRALRRLATDPSLGAPARAGGPAATASARSRRRCPPAWRIGAAPASAFVLAMLLVLAVLAAAAAGARARGGGSAG